MIPGKLVATLVNINFMQHEVRKDTEPTRNNNNNNNNNNMHIYIYIYIYNMSIQLYRL